MTTEDKLAVALDALKQIKVLKEETFGDHWSNDKALKTDDVHDIVDGALCFCLPIDEVRKELVEQGIFTEGLKSWASEKLAEVRSRQGVHPSAAPIHEGTSPRTDASFSLYHMEGGGGIKSLRRNMEVMESELTAAQAEIAELKKAFDVASDALGPEIEEVKRLRAALEHVESCFVACETEGGFNPHMTDDHRSEVIRRRLLFDLQEVVSSAIAPAISGKGEA